MGFKKDGSFSIFSASRNQKDALIKLGKENARLNDEGDISKVLFDKNGNYIMSYPILDYPEANTLITQYGQHTHLVFTIEESIGHSGQTYHERFSAYSEFLESEIQQAKDAQQIQSLTENLTASIIAQKKADLAVTWLRANTGASPAEQICKLFNALEKEDSSAAGANAYLYNKINGIVEEIFINTNQIFDHLKNNYAESLDPTFVTYSSDQSDSAIGKCKLKEN